MWIEVGTLNIFVLVSLGQSTPQLCEMQTSKQGKKRKNHHKEASVSTFSNNQIRIEITIHMSSVVKKQDSQTQPS